LAKHAGRVTVSNPMRTKAIASAKVKTDKVDAKERSRRRAQRWRRSRREPRLDRARTALGRSTLSPVGLRKDARRNRQVALHSSCISPGNALPLRRRSPWAPSFLTSTPGGRSGQALFAQSA
jgi:hypothetical protein